MMSLVLGRVQDSYDEGEMDRVARMTKNITDEFIRVLVLKINKYNFYDYSY